MSYTPLQVQGIARLSAAYANVDIQKSGLYGGGTVIDLPLKIQTVQKSIQYWYNLTSGADSTLTGTSNYLYSLCGKYGLRAAQNIAGGGSVIPPIQPQIIHSPIHITGAMFSSALSWTGQNNDGLTIYSSYFLQVFWNGLNRLLVQNYEWTRTATGFDIINNGVTISGFDATGQNLTDDFYVFISI